MCVLVGIVTGVDGGSHDGKQRAFRKPDAWRHDVSAGGLPRGAPGPYQQSVNLHWHRETEFVLVTKGAVRARVERETVVLPPAVTGVDPRDSRLATYASEIVDADADKAEAFELLIKASPYRILYELWARSRRVPVDATKPDEGMKLTRIKPILSFIHQHYAEPIRLKDLSDLINMSEGYSCRYFHRLFGVTPVQYINEYRITQAVRLLQSSDCSVLEACYEVGFQNISYFTRVFKHYRRCNPSDLAPIGAPQPCQIKIVQMSDQIPQDNPRLISYDQSADKTWCASSVGLCRCFFLLG